MKIIKLIIPIICLNLIISCSSTLTIEDVNKKVVKAEKANSKALEKTKEAINARKQLTIDYKKTEIKKVEKRVSGIDKQIKAINKSSKNSSNETAASSLNNAVDALEVERKQLIEEKEKINNIVQQDWEKDLNTTDSLMSQMNANLNKIEKSLEVLKK